MYWNDYATTMAVGNIGKRVEVEQNSEDSCIQ